MSDTVQTSFLHRLLNTPLRDALSGRLSARLDWRARLAAADLPVAANELIVRTVNRTRLWRIERAAVANELIAHFRDALESERQIESIVDSFGDSRQTARLIRRAKIRNRSTFWHIWRWMRRAFLLLTVVYAVAAGEFFFSHPVPRVDYAAQLTQSWASTPESDRAWPMYRQALLAMFFDHPADSHAPPKENYPLWLGDNLDGKHWSEMEPWLRQHAADIALIRQAAAKPVFGFVIGDPDSHENDLLRPKDRVAPEADDDLLVSRYSSWYVANASSLANVLAADVKLAEIDHDSARVQIDVESILNLADQLRGNDHLFISGLVAIHANNIALNSIERLLRNDPQALGDAQLIALAHRIGRPRTASDLTTFSGERMFFYDIVQHIYSDDGHGDGHITADGVRHLIFLTSHINRADYPEQYTVEQKLAFAVGPAMVLASASRKELVDKYNQLVDIYDANLHVPARDADWNAEDQMIRQIKDSPPAFMRFGILAALAPALDGAMINAERYLGRRDGVMTAIALELYRRRHGNYPSRLDSLVPTFMPEIPADRITGDPIKYKIVAGDPLLYSVGADRTDNGGIPPINPSTKEPDPRMAANWGEDPARAVRGDWILYPIPARPDAD